MSALLEHPTSANAPRSVAETAPVQQEDCFPPWDALLDAARQRSERRAWWVASIAAALAFSAVIGLAVAVNFRRVVPYLLTLDRATGNVEYIDAIDDRVVKGYQHLLDMHWVNRYVMARESYFFPLLQLDYDSVMDMSAEAVGKEYDNDRNGAFARQERFGKQVEIKPTIISTQLTSNEIGQFATVRFSTVTRRLDSDTQAPPEYHIVTLRYTYQPKMFGKELDLIRNPLGFKTLSYRSTDELPPQRGKDALPQSQ
ncbi:type IV secretion system protein VirB8 [Duganella sp. SG902]|uniref:virB8 family protein n=1 Tax=Duganella sp. SG902 TaxID=2587016 RepID=UPI00159E089D|nr:type IV secretion system protein [Duganella sp. SG902]NVM77462.1 type IV secretion system protein VirB8 [Duganella sp. SG902]